ncbi:MAG: hypothetical protein MZV64_26760 [Ignavibacteriales bacterium]|nr:hypothetical protein [Ignavibacteriales bacterium]
MFKVIKEFKKPISNEIVKIGPDLNQDQIILATETSCDETAASIVLNGRTVFLTWWLLKLKLIDNTAG